MNAWRGEKGSTGDRTGTSFTQRGIMPLDHRPDPHHRSPPSINTHHFQRPPPDPTHKPSAAPTNTFSLFFIHQNIVPSHCLPKTHLSTIPTLLSIVAYLRPVPETLIPSSSIKRFLRKLIPSQSMDPIYGLPNSRSVGARFGSETRSLRRRRPHYQITLFVRIFRRTSHCYRSCPIRNSEVARTRAPKSLW